ALSHRRTEGRDRAEPVPATAGPLPLGPPRGRVAAVASPGLPGPAGGQFDDRDVGGGAHAGGRRPGAGAPGDVQLGVAVALQAGQGGVGAGGDEVAGPQLAAVGVAGELEVDAVVDGLVDLHRLMGEQHAGTPAVPVAEGAGEVGALALVLAGHVVDA